MEDDCYQEKLIQISLITDSDDLVDILLIRPEDIHGVISRTKGRYCQLFTHLGILTTSMSLSTLQELIENPYSDTSY